MALGKLTEAETIRKGEIAKHVNELKARIVSLENNGPQSGEIAYFGRNTAPTGWLKANGAAVSRTTYAALFAAIGTTFGAGNGTTTFNLPDLRGEFLRGWDDSRGVDSGRSFGGWQTGTIENHRHSYGRLPHFSVERIGGGSRYRPGDGTDNAYPTDYTSDYGGTETRPRNIALLACIKY